jgi:hypothetical protein
MSTSRKFQKDFMDIIRNAEMHHPKLFNMTQNENKVTFIKNANGRYDIWMENPRDRNNPHRNYGAKYKSNLNSTEVANIIHEFLRFTTETRFS